VAVAPTKAAAAAAAAAVAAAAAAAAAVVAADADADVADVDADVVDADADDADDDADAAVENQAGRGRASHPPVSDCTVDRAAGAAGPAWPLPRRRQRRRRHHRRRRHPRHRRRRLRLRLQRPRVALASVPGVRDGCCDGDCYDDGGGVDDDDGAGYLAWPSAGLPEVPPLPPLLTPVACFCCYYRYSLLLSFVPRRDCRRHVTNRRRCLRCLRRRRRRRRARSPHRAADRDATAHLPPTRPGNLARDRSRGLRLRRSRINQRSHTHVQSTRIYILLVSY